MNREQSREVISTKQLFAIMMTLLVGHGFTILPTLVTRQAKHDGWISTIIAGIVSIVLMNIMLYAMKFFEGKTFIRICEVAFGKYLGKLPVIIFTVYYVIFSALGIRLLVDLIDAWLLPITPIEVLTIFILAICYYLCRNGVKILGRLSETLIWVVFPTFLFLFIPFFIYRNILLLLPVGGVGLTKILSSSLPGFYAFLGFESILLLYPYARETATHKEIVRSCNNAMALVIVLKTFIVVSSIAVFGDREIQFFMYPVLEYFKLITFPVIERVEFVQIYFMMFIFLGSIFSLYKLTTIGIGQLTNVINYKNIALFLAIPIYYLSKVPPNVAEVFKMINLFSTFGFVGIQVLVFLVLSIAFIRRGRQSR